MDLTPFDAGTRRRCGLTAGSMLAGLVWRAADDASARRRPITAPTSRLGRASLALLLAAQAAGLLAEVATEPAEAAFPGGNGVIAFASTRTSGNGVNNPGGDYEIFTMKPDGSGLFQVTVNTTFERDPAWSADGNWLAYTGAGEIYIRRDRIAFEETRRLTTNTASDYKPTFSPDGRKIAFVSYRDGNGEIYVMDTTDSDHDGNGDHLTRLTNDAAGDVQPAWSPDGSTIAFTSNRGGADYEVYVMNADGTGQKRLTKNAAFDGSPAWSPDGTKIAFMSTRGGGDLEIYVMKVRPESKQNRPKARTNNDVDDGDPDWLPIP